MISIIIPVYNEGERVIDAYKSLTEYLTEKNADYELLFVDDGSDKKTKEQLAHLLQNDDCTNVITNDHNKGKGFSVRRGFMESKGEYVLFMDADLSTPVCEMEKLMTHLELGCDLAIGSRALPSSEIRLHQPIYREYLGKVFNVILRKILLLDVRDTQCGFKAFRKEAAKDIFERQTLNGFCFDVEVLQIAKERGYKTCEIPIAWFDSQKTSLKLYKECIRMFIDLITIKINSYKGKYS